MKILGGELEPSAGTVANDSSERVERLRQDQFAYENERVLDVVLQGHVGGDARARRDLCQSGVETKALKRAGGTRWALRVNPSSGNLHPTEGYVLIGGISELGEAPGLLHYAPAEHGLERRADCPEARAGGYDSPENRAPRR